MARNARTKPKLPPLERVAQAESALAEAEEASAAAGEVHLQLLERARALTEERTTLVHEHPEWVDHRSNPVDVENPVGQLDAELRRIDVADAELRYGHCQELERVARQRAEDTIRAHGEAVEDARREGGDALPASYEAALRRADELAHQLLDYAGRSQHLARIRGLDVRAVPLDALANQRRTLEEMLATMPPVPRSPEVGDG